MQREDPRKDLWEWSRHGWFQQARRIRDDAHGLHSTRRARGPRDQEVQVLVQRPGLHRRDRPRCGNRRRCNGSAGAELWAETKRQRGSSRNAILQEPCNRPALPRAWAGCPGFDMKWEARPNPFRSVHHCEWRWSFIASWNDDGFDFAVAVHELFEDAIELVKMRVASDKGSGLEAAAGDEVEGTATDGWSVMEGGAHGDVVVMDAIGVQRDSRILGWTTKEVDNTAFANELDSFFPCFRDADGFNGDVYTAIVGRESASLLDGLTDGTGLDDMRGTEVLCGFCLARVTDDCDGFTTRECGNVEDH